MELYIVLQELYTLLSSSSEKNQGRAATKDQEESVRLNNVDNEEVILLERNLCNQAIRQCQLLTTTTKTAVNQDTTCLALILDILHLLWTKQPQQSSTTTIAAAAHWKRNAAASGIPFQSTLLQAQRRGLELLPYLMTLWDHYTNSCLAAKAALTSRNNTKKQNDTRIALPILTIFRFWAKSPELKPGLIKAGLVKALKQNLVLFQQQQQPLQQSSSLWPAITGLCKDMIFRATSTEKQFMYQEWMEAIVGCLTTTQPGAAASCCCVEAVTACLWNWAVEPVLAMKMAEHAELWAALYGLLSKSSSSQSLGAQRNLLSTLGSIIAACADQFDSDDEEEEPPRQLASNTRTWIISYLFTTLKEAQDVDLRRRAVRTIRCLSTCAWGRDLLHGNANSGGSVVQRLLRLLVNVEEQDDARVQTCLALKNLLAHLQNKQWSQLGPHVERTVVKVIQDKALSASDKILLHAMQLLQTCLEFSPWRRGAGCLSSELFERLYNVLSDHATEATYHEAVSTLVWQLLGKTAMTTTSSSREAEESLIVKIPAIVDIFASLITPSGVEFDVSRGKTIECMKTAVQDEAAKTKFVEHDSLLSNLVNVCIVSSGDRKADAKSLLVLLVSDL